MFWPIDRPSPTLILPPRRMFNRSRDNPSGRQHLADPAANELALLLIGSSVETDVIGDHRRTLQHHDAVADLQRFRDRMGDEHGGLAVLLHQPDEFGA